MTTLEKLYERYMVDENGAYVESEQELQADAALYNLLKKLLVPDIANTEINLLDDAIVEYGLAAKKFGFQEGFMLAMGLVMECRADGAVLMENR